VSTQRTCCWLNAAPYTACFDALIRKTCTRCKTCTLLAYDGLVSVSTTPRVAQREPSSA